MHTSGIRETFDRIRVAVLKNPQAADTLAARTWVLETARDYGWEAAAIETAQLPNPPDLAVTPEFHQLAQSVLAIGWAQRGDIEASTQAWTQFLRALRLRLPNIAGDLAQSLALTWQLRGQPEQADAVYQQLSETYFLNPELKDFAERRRQRLKLVGQPVPALAAADIHSQPLDWSTLQGKVVMLDFWATNCRPCIEELPRLRRRYAEFHSLGVEFLGISFDESPGDVEQFRMSQPIPWRVVLDRETAEEAFHVTLIPCLMLVDRTGHIAATDVRPDDLRAALDALLHLADSK